MLITIQVRQRAVPSLAREQNHTTASPTDLRQPLASDSSRRPEQDAAELLRLMRELGLTLEPMHPLAEEPELQTYFTVEVPDAQMAEPIAQRLRGCAAVEAAYLKPMDELP